MYGRTTLCLERSVCGDKVVWEVQGESNFEIQIPSETGISCCEIID